MEFPFKKSGKDGYKHLDKLLKFPEGRLGKIFLASMAIAFIIRMFIITILFFEPLSIQADILVRADSYDHVNSAELILSLTQGFLGGDAPELLTGEYKSLAFPARVHKLLAFRTPAYPSFILFFILLGKFLFGNYYFLMVSVAQSFVDIASMILFFAICRLVLRNDKLSVLGASVFGLSPSIFLYSIVIHPETLATFFLLLSVLLFLVASRTDDKRLFVLLGLSSGISMLLRPSTLMIGPLFLLVYILSALRKRSLNRQHAVNALMTLFLIFITILPWLCFTAVYYGHPFLTLIPDINFGLYATYIYMDMHPQEDMSDVEYGRMIRSDIFELKLNAVDERSDIYDAALSDRNKSIPYIMDHLDIFSKITANELMNLYTKPFYRTHIIRTLTVFLLKDTEFSEHLFSDHTNTFFFYLFPTFTLLGIAGIILLLNEKRSRCAGVTLLLSVIYFSLIYAPVGTIVRYRISFWSFLLLGFLAFFWRTMPKIDEKIYKFVGKMLILSLLILNPLVLEQFSPDKSLDQINLARILILDYFLLVTGILIILFIPPKMQKKVLHDRN